jgi:CRISPR-associated protein Csd1
MLLKRLCDQADRLDLAPPMYLKTPIRWLIDLDREGRLLGIVKTDGPGGKRDRGKEFLAPHRERTIKVAAKLLADNGEYVLGVARDPKKQDRVDRCHRAFVEEVRRCAQDTGHPAVGAVARFYDGYRLLDLKLPEDFQADQALTFRVDGTVLIDLEEVRLYWARTAGDSEPAGAAGTSCEECLVCGRLGPLLPNVPFKIKPIPDGQTSGMALVSTNAPAFESYGLDGVSCAPICPRCGEQFSKVANALIQGDHTHLRVGPLVYLFWTRDESWSPASILSNPEPEEVRALLASAFGGDRSALRTDPAPFYATALSASGGRVVVRDWLETTVPRARDNLARYFALQQLVDRDGGEGRPYGLYALAAATVRDANKELRPETPRTLLHAALNGGPLPTSLLAQAVRRNRAEQAVTRPRAALIKMVLLSQRPDFPPEDQPMVQLDPANRDPAYLCGRLLAVLERIQQAAIPGTSATIVDRFFGTASSAPASVFGRLLRGCQAHLTKLRKEKPGAFKALKRRLEEVVHPGLEAFPRMLTLEQQGLFSLGYFHQCAHDRAAAIAHRQRRTGPAPDVVTTE